MKKEKKKIALLGKSAAGKDSLRKMLLEKGFRPAISCTTRPIRANETDGVDYNFMNVEEFNRLENEKFFLESETFNVVGNHEWKYGKSYMTLVEADVFIATPNGISNMINKTSRDLFYVVEIECPNEVRIERLRKRGDEEREMQRRLKTDDFDFSAPRNFNVDEIIDSNVPGSFEEFIDRFVSSNDPNFLLSDEMQGYLKHISETSALMEHSTSSN